MILEKLPTEIILLIFSYLTAEDVFALQSISKGLYDIVYKELHESRTWTITCDRDMEKRSIDMECDQLSSTKNIDLKMIEFKKLHKIDIRVPLSRNGRQSRVSIGKFARKISRSKALKKLQIIPVLGHQFKGSNGCKRWAKKKNVTKDILTALTGLDTMHGLEAKVSLTVEIPPKGDPRLYDNVKGYSERRLKIFEKSIQDVSRIMPVIRRSARLSTTRTAD
jgi:hypothetical protein